MNRRWSNELSELSTLKAALGREQVDALKSRARLFKTQCPTRKADLVEHLAGQLEGKGLTALWERLDDLSRKAVAEIVHGNCEPLDEDLFEAKYGNIPSWQAGSPGRKIAADPLSMLVFADGRIPNDLKRRLESLAPKPEDVTLATVNEPPAKITTGGSYKTTHDVRREETAAAALYDVRAVLHLVAAGKIKVGATTGQVGLAGVKTILPVLRNGDYFAAKPDQVEGAQTTIRAFAWPLLLQAGGLVRTAGPKLELTKTGSKALSSPPHEIIRGLWKRWLDATLFDEVHRIVPLKGLSRRGALNAVADRRASIAIGLDETEPGRWIEVGEFLRYLTATGNSLQVARDPWKLYVGDSEYGSLGYDGYDEWLPKWYLMIFLWEYAATLGLVDVAYTDPEVSSDEYRQNWGMDNDYLCVHQGLLFFRINTLGAWILGHTDEFVQPRDESRPLLRVLPNLEITAMAEPPPADRLVLERFATPRSQGVWALRLPELLAASEQGLPPAEARAFLEARCPDPLPNTVADLFDQAASRIGRVTDLGPARLYECADPELAILLAGDTAMSGLCHRAGERMLVVPANAEPRFRSSLRRLGYVVPGK